MFYAGIDRLYQGAYSLAPLYDTEIVGETPSLAVGRRGPEKRQHAQVTSGSGVLGARAASHAREEARGRSQ
jgi:hypothetical protein